MSIIPKSEMTEEDIRGNGKTAPARVVPRKIKGPCKENRGMANEDEIQ